MGLRDTDLVRLAHNGVHAGFLEPHRKAGLLAEIDHVAAQHGLGSARC
ncbi:hypothetical protein [Saccharopolyspora montiporae]|nr:hypothetical protein [Saccharopolyspora sp. HNM0983]